MNEIHGRPDRACRARCWRARRPLRAADVTFERLLNPEPQNWLMVHHDYSAQRLLQLDTINKSNIKNMKLLFAVAIGGTSPNEALEATPLVEDGFMYMSSTTGAWSTRSTCAPASTAASCGRWIPARRSSAAIAASRCGAISSSRPPARTAASSRPTRRPARSSGTRTCAISRTWSCPRRRSRSRTTSSSAPPAATRACATGSSSLDPKTGNVKWKTFAIPAPGEPGSETWKDKNNAWQTGGGAFYVTGSYDPQTNLTYWGSGNPVPGYDASYRPGDNLFTNSAIAFNAANGQDGVVPPVHAERQPRLRRDRHAHPHRHQGERRGSQDPHPCRPQRFQLHLRPFERPVSQGRASTSARSPGPRASIRRPASRSTTTRARTSRSTPSRRTSTRTR